MVGLFFRCLPPKIPVPLRLLQQYSYTLLRLLQQYSYTAALEYKCLCGADSRKEDKAVVVDSTN